MLKWDQLRIILAIARDGSFAAAARTLGIDQTTVSRQLDQLEKELGPLFERRTNGVFATELGEESISAAERIETEVFNLLRQRDGSQTQLTGTVRVTTTPFFAAKIFAPYVQKFSNEYPCVQVELIGDSRSYDLSRREADVAVRFSRPTQNGLVTKSLGNIRFAFYASKSDERTFEKQRFLSYSSGSSHDSLQKFIDKNIPDDKIILRSNSTQTLLEATYSGIGCTLLPCFIGGSDPLLKLIDSPVQMGLMTLWLTYHEDLRHSPRVRAIIDFIDSIFETLALDY